MSEPETLEQIAEGLAVVICPHRLGCIRYACDEEDLPTDCDCEHGVVRAVILAALREVEARGEQRAAVLGGALLDSAVERAEKAEAEVERLKEMLRHYGMVCDNPDQCLLDDDTKEQP